MSDPAIEVAASTPSTIADPPREISEALKAYYDKQGIAFGEGDLFCVGGTSPAGRLAPLLSLALAMRGERGPMFPLVQIIVGPRQDTASLADDFVGAIGRELAVWRGSPLDETDLGVVRRRLVVTSLGDARHASVLAAIESVPPNSFVVIEGAASFWGDDVAPYIAFGADKPALQEDTWAPHLYALTRAAIAAAGKAPCYVALDAGENFPTRVPLRDLLFAIDDCGVFGGDRPADPIGAIAPRVDEWLGKLKEGRIGAVLKDIDALTSLDDLNRTHLKAQMLHRAGLTDQAAQMVSTLAENLAGVAPDALVNLAEIAAHGNAHALSERILAAVGDDLAIPEALHIGLSVAHRIGNDALEDQFAERLARLFPDAPVLRARAVQTALDQRDFAGAALHARRFGQDEDADFYAAIAAAFSTDDVPDYDALVAAQSGREGDWVGRCQIACVGDALARRLPEYALLYALEFFHTGYRPRAAARFLNEAIALALVTRGPADQLAVPAAVVVAAIQAVTLHLAGAPDDGMTRVGLAQALSVETSGDLGYPFLAAALVFLAERPLTPTPSPTQGVARMELLDDPSIFLEAALSWLSAEAPVMVGKTTLPTALLTENPDDVISTLRKAIQTSGIHDDDVEVVQMLATLGATIAPHASEPTRAIDLLRIAAGKMAAMGERQRARDFAESIMAMSSTPQGARQAWFAMADIYHRAGNPVEGLVAMCCALNAAGTADAEQLWLETTTIIRLFRDLGLLPQAREIIDRARPQFAAFVETANNAHRVDLLELQLRHAALHRDAARSRSDVEALLDETTANAATVLRLVDDPAPVGIFLAEVLRSASTWGVAEPKPGADAYESLLALVAPSAAILMRTIRSPAPTPDDVMAIVNGTQQARYAEDAAYDAQRAALAAGRLLASAAADDPAVAAFAIELMADNAVPTPGWETSAAPPPKLASLPEPAAIALDIARDGIAVALAGFDADANFVHVLVQPDAFGPTIRDTTFSPTHLEAWSGAHLPYRYGVDENDPNLFLTSTEGISLGALPQTPVVLIADTALQQFPPNLYREGEAFAGALRPIAAAPSLSWLRAARAQPPRGTRTRAWISTADSDGQTLAMVADRLKPALNLHAIPLDSAAAIPDDLAGSRLAIVAAHGKVLPEGRFFQLVADDGGLSVSANDFARALRNVGVVVLFVCSGGRADKHPVATTTVGLARQLLDRGCSAVVSSPWPLDARVTYHWLPPFLDAWREGARLVDCVFLANRTVDHTFPYSPALSLALSVYGNPFVTAGPTITSTKGPVGLGLGPTGGAGHGLRGTASCL